MKVLRARKLLALFDQQGRYKGSARLKIVEYTKSYSITDGPTDRPTVLATFRSFVFRPWLSSFLQIYLSSFLSSFVFRLSSFVFHVYQTAEKDLVLLVVLYVVLCANLSVVFMLFSYIFHRHSSFTVIFQTKLKNQN